MISVSVEDTSTLSASPRTRTSNVSGLGAARSDSRNEGRRQDRPPRSSRDTSPMHGQRTSPSPKARRPEPAMSTNVITTVDVSATSAGFATEAQPTHARHRAMANHCMTLLHLGTERRSLGLSRPRIQGAVTLVIEDLRQTPTQSVFVVGSYPGRVMCSGEPSFGRGPHASGPDVDQSGRPMAYPPVRS